MKTYTVDMILNALPLCDKYLNSDGDMNGYFKLILNSDTSGEILFTIPENDGYKDENGDFVYCHCAWDLLEIDGWVKINKMLKSWNIPPLGEAK